MKNNNLFTDALILYSVITTYEGKEKPQLKDIMFFTDYVDRSIPEYDELESILYRLQKAGLITKDGQGRYGVLNTAPYEKVYQRKLSHSKTLAYLQACLRRLKDYRSDSSLVFHRPLFTKKEYNTAYQEYSKEFWKIFHEIIKGHQRKRPSFKEKES